MAKIGLKPMSLLVDRPHRAEAARQAHDHAPHGGVGALALGALGVVYGDIGTSPLYAMDQIFRVAPARAPEDALGAVSLVIWTLTLIVAIKYALLVLQAQNDGEGGVFALYDLLHDRKDRRVRMLLWALMLGAGLLIGDGMITPRDQRALRCRRPRRGRAGVRKRRHPNHARAPHCALRHPVQGRLWRRYRFRADRALVVRGDRRVGRRRDRSQPSD